MKSRSIRLEFLRTGPEHNQLLSPLTPYLAVCGNRPAETVHLSAEHLDVIDRLDRLRYTHGITTNEADLRAASEPVVQLLSSIRGLHEELACVMQDKVELVHLRLILSAQELALLPFELAYGPNTRPPTRDIGLASPPQLVLTREARRLARKVDFWPDKPRILVVMADPTANGLPRKPHMLALRNALDPWIEPASSTDPDAASKPIDEYVTVLDRASIERIAEACTKTEYTHVHILCHGALSPGREPRFGLALHDSFDPGRWQWVDAAKLASALTAGAPNERRAPSVVTLCVCDSGNVATAVRPNASIAHELHRSGIPFVVASQLPLTFEGSTLLVGKLYAQLFRGVAPLDALGQVRAAMVRALSHTHDWAALIAYSNLPEDSTSLMREARLESLKVQVEMPFRRLDRFGLKLHDDSQKPADVDAEAAKLVDDKRVLDSLERAANEAKLKGPNAHNRYVSSYKRVAALGIAYRGDVALPAQIDQRKERRALLERAFDVTDEIFTQTRSTWSATQRAALHFAISVHSESHRTPYEVRLRELVDTAHVLLREERAMLSSHKKLTALDERSLSNNDLLSLTVQLHVLDALADRASEDVASAINNLCNEGRHNAAVRSSALYSLMRELHRYRGWWLVLAHEIKWPRTDEAIKRADDALAKIYQTDVQRTYRDLKARNR